ncbi:SAM-dependent DNA methyltransferase [Nonomuraea sp. K274]|uniref:site-specific DNA-methyltransferase (adenine-specific) n=1 Tax=Nonomuraea cypriaca TaxID=1187855 RepID=A0A931ABG2_9ACTN|nr:N-6 DNA methylase [Nonomuraea cypriaca]MBF8186272.1 SAM-dependent DNA methyltransferase [Nonomuraea cypriaca]
MSSLTVAQLTRHLVRAADILRGKGDAQSYLDILSGILLLKRVSDQPDILHVPDSAHWFHIAQSKGKRPALVMSEALRELAHHNPNVLDGMLETLDISRRLGPSQINALIEHFDQIPLANGDLEFDDVVGRAYDCFLGWVAENAGKRGGEFYTPRSVVALMVRLVQPEAGHSVYDPFVGSAGMLIHAKEYVDEHAGIWSDLALYGQDISMPAWTIARLNLFFHGITSSSIFLGDTLSTPLHLATERELKTFDRVLTNPPFSVNYVEHEVTYPERMRYGWIPGQGKKADLMNVQHVLASLRPDGIGAVVAPHGVLFRGGVEAEIRRRIIGDGRLGAVIGIGPNVFYGTAIPACILLLRGTDGPPRERNGEVLFIDAEREVVTGRTQNYLGPQHVEKIVDVYQNWSHIPGFSRAVSVDEVAENGFNLNIRRYVETSPKVAPPLNVRAALFGGVPRTEVEAEAPKFHTFGIDPMELFRAKDGDYLDFPAEGYKAAVGRIEKLAEPGVRNFIQRYRSWWTETGPRIAELSGTQRLLRSRSSLMESFSEELAPLRILDHYQLVGIFAAWWSHYHDDLRLLDRLGFSAVTDRTIAASSDHSVVGSADLASSRVLDSLGEDLKVRVEKLVRAERQTLVDTYRRWCDRYEVSLMDLEEQREALAARLSVRLRGLGYGRSDRDV